MSKSIGYLVAVIAIGIAYSVYDNITGGRGRCEKQCYAEGAIDFVWVPESKQLDYNGEITNVVESRCTCYTSEEKQRKREEFESMKDAIRKYKKTQGG